MTGESAPSVDIMKGEVRVAIGTRFVKRSDVDPVDRAWRTMCGFWSPVSLRVGEEYRLVLATGEEMLVRIWMSPAGATPEHPVRVTARVVS